MKLSPIILIVTAAFMLTGCEDKEARSAEKKADPTFMFWCFRKEIVSANYHVPAMKNSQIAAYIQNRLKVIPGYEGSAYDLPSQSMTVKYRSSTVRKMNFEEAISQAGFKVNKRPASANMKLPEGHK